MLIRVLVTDRIGRHDFYYKFIIKIIISENEQKNEKVAVSWKILCMKRHSMDCFLTILILLIYIVKMRRNFQMHCCQHSLNQKISKLSMIRKTISR